jgi:hypothetical protein
MMNKDEERRMLEGLAPLAEGSPAWQAVEALKEEVLDQMLERCEDERIGGDEKLQLVGKVAGVREFWRTLAAERDRARGVGKDEV